MRDRLALLPYFRMVIGHKLDFNPVPPFAVPLEFPRRALGRGFGDGDVKFPFFVVAPFLPLQVERHFVEEGGCPMTTLGVTRPG